MFRSALKLVAVAVALLSLGFIEKLFTLREIMDESTHILVGRIEKVDPARQTAVATMTKALKGKLDYTTVQMNLATGAAGHPAYMLERLKPGADLILFFKLDAEGIGCCAHTGDTWFQLFANDEPKNRTAVWWRLSHVEVYLPRTYDGNTRDLIRLTTDIIAGRAKSPPPNPKAPKIDVAAKPASKPAAVSAAPNVAVPKGGFHRQAEFRAPGGSEVRGISWADVNGDGRLDICFNRQAGNLLLVNQGDSWKDMTRTLGLPAAGSRSAAWADYNADDHVDLMTSNFQLFTSAAGALRDDSRLIPAPDRRNSEGGGWIDYDGDGLPDLLLTNGEHGIRLWQNTGRGPDWFRDASDQAGLGPKGLGAGNGDFVVAFDADSDGYADLFYNLGPGLLLRNKGDGTFAANTRSGISLPDANSYKRGIAVADFDNDEDLDLFVPAAKTPRLYRNNSDGTFTDVFPQSGDPTAETDPSFAAAWGDVNADGNLDLFVCHTTGSSRLYLGDGKGRFKDVSDAAGVRKLSPAYAAAFADVDGDGDLDLAVNLADRVVIATNDFEKPLGRSSLVVSVQPRRGLIGAVVRVNNADGRSMGMRVVANAEGCGGQASPTAHFGLPTGPFRVTVCLSDGRVGQKTIDLTVKPGVLTFHDGDFQ